MTKTCNSAIEALNLPSIGRSLHVDDCLNLVKISLYVTLRDHEEFPRGDSKYVFLRVELYVVFP